MLDELTFKGKRHIVLDKFDATYIMNKRNDGKWNVIIVPRKYSIAQSDSNVYENDDEAFEFYKARMESFGFKQFPVIEE
jgi:hypothetical protein